MKEGTVLEEVEIHLEANGQEAQYIEEMFTFTGANMMDFVGSVRCTAPPGEGMFTGVAVEIDAGDSGPGMTSQQETCPCRSIIECDNVLYHTLWSPKIPGSLRPPTSSSPRAGSFRPRLCSRQRPRPRRANGRVILIAGRLIRKSRHKGRRRLRLSGYSLPATMGCGKVWLGWNPGWMRGLTRWSHG